MLGLQSIFSSYTKTGISYNARFFMLELQKSVYKFVKKKTTNNIF